jgi:hypothetical protein
MTLLLGNKESSLRMSLPVSSSARCSKIRRVDKLEIELRAVAAKVADASEAESLLPHGPPMATSSTSDLSPPSERPNEGLN